MIDVYSLKPIDTETLREAARATEAIVTAEDHYPAGGLGEAVLSALADDPAPTAVLAVGKRPMSGNARELREHVGISASEITQAAVKLTKSKRGKRTLARSK